MSEPAHATENLHDGGDDDERGLYWVAAYLTDLQFGGPEEGGWFYDCGTLVTDPDIYHQFGYGVAGFVERDEAEAHAEAMRERLLVLNHGRQPKHSVLSTGVFEIHVFRSPTLPSHFPATTPRYE